MVLSVWIFLTSTWTVPGLMQSSMEVVVVVTLRVWVFVKYPVAEVWKTKEPVEGTFQVAAMPEETVIELL